MEYKDAIRGLINSVPKILIDLEIPREIVRTPTQASSNFITNREQGDWAERLILRAINETSKHFVAVKYGKSDDRVAGDEGFSSFYQNFQIELDTIGKRPDILILKKEHYKTEWNFDISNLSSDQIHNIVPLAIAGLEIRSSAFLIEKYEYAMREKTAKFTQIALETRDEILSKFFDLLDHPSRHKYIEILKGLTPETLSAAGFVKPNWSSSERLLELSNHFVILKNSIKEIQKRDFLSITPKVEDLKVVYKWIETYNVPHFYFQVFFDKVYGISYENILKIIADPANEGLIFAVEKDVKNQNKTTIKIKSKSGIEIANKVDEPIHKSVRKEMDRGRLLFYVTFEGGSAYLDIQNLITLLGISENAF
jgi:hypothetical protein